MSEVLVNREIVLAVKNMLDADKGGRRKPDLAKYAELDDLVAQFGLPDVSYSFEEQLVTKINELGCNNVCIEWEDESGCAVAVEGNVYFVHVTNTDVYEIAKTLIKLATGQEV